jgi:predicted hotdog family 3-hydroxylacyl-ACP dehydratase
MLVSKNEILEYIPQQPPFSMVDTLEAINGNSAHSSFHILESNVLSSEGIFRESGLVENMAQTIALFAGYKAREANLPPAIGYIAGIKNLSISRRPNVDETLFTQVEIINEVMNMQIAKAEVFDAENQELASCELRIFITE